MGASMFFELYMLLGIETMQQLECIPGCLLVVSIMHAKQ